MITELIATLARAAEPWRETYANSIPASTAVLFAHLAGMVVAGGLGLAADRGTVRVTGAAESLGALPVGGRDAERARHLGELARAHRAVVAALGVVLASGVLLALADVEEYASSAVYWTKMALVAALLVNGFAMTRAERSLRAVDAADGGRARALWGRLRTHAIVSAALWLVTVLAGTTLGNV